MLNETMTAKERFLASVALEPVDRHPVFPLIQVFAPRYYGITQAEAWKNHEVARDAMLNCWEEFGYDYGWKANYYWPMPPGKFTAAPVRNLIPGKQLPEDSLNQVIEKELFSRDDYDRIIALGWNGFWDEKYEEMSGKPISSLKDKQVVVFNKYINDMKVLNSRGMPTLVGAAIDSVLMAFSMCRTLTSFTKDLYQIPDKVQAAMDATCDDLINNGIEVCKATGNNVAWIVLERGSGFYYRKQIFERFELPFLKRYCDAFIAEGLIPWLHFDTDWSINIPYLKELPKKKCVCDLDSCTDIFKVKEELRDHMCISGDVSPSLLSLGKPEVIEQYCKKLISVVGKDGGFMLTSGCECPIDAKPENIRAMIKTAKTYKG